LTEWRLSHFRRLQHLVRLEKVLPVETLEVTQVARVADIARHITSAHNVGRNALPVNRLRPPARPRTARQLFLVKNLRPRLNNFSLQEPAGFHLVVP
jgi:hypothetical protein